MSHSSSKSNRSSAPRPLPKHTALKVARNGVFAYAPYNFVPLPEKVVPAQDVPDHDRYQGNTGWIDCDLETLTPLYVRGLLTTTTFAEYGATDVAFPDLSQKAQQERARFFAIRERVIIPGSSLRGMIRALVEIAAFGKVGPVTGKQIVFRAVGDPTSLGQFYRSRVLGKNKAHAPDNHFEYPSLMLKGGYLRYRDGQWCIQPAREHEHESFVHVEYADAARIGVRPGAFGAHRVFVKPAARRTLDRGKRSRGKLILDAAVVEPGHVIRAAAQQSAPPGMVEAVLVVTGHMGGSHPKHWHCAIYAPDQDARLINIPDDLWKLYEEDRDLQRGIPGRKLMRDGDALFYLLDKGGNLVFFGPTQMFRLPYGKGIVEFIPEHLRDETVTDMAEAIFGYVKSNKMPCGKQRAYAGRVFVQDAVACPNQGAIMETAIVTPQILASPKPSTFQHYLTQPDEAAQNRSHLKHYASPTPDETVIRGHKLYWHRKVTRTQDYAYQGAPEEREKHKKQLTGITPVRAGARFSFRVYFENLTDEELGALLWVLDLPADCAHHLGMAKPLGLGSARIEVTALRLTDRLARYRALFSGDQWTDGARADANVSDFKRRFEGYVLARIAPEDRNNAGALADTLRICELLCLLSYDNAPPLTETRYMTIEPVNEYTERPVLPLPSTVAGCEQRGPKSSPVVSRQPVAAPAVAVSRSASKPAASTSAKPAQESQVATLITVPDKGQARVRLASGLELDCTGFSPLAKNKPGSRCRARVIAGSDGAPKRAEFLEWQG